MNLEETPARSCIHCFNSALTLGLLEDVRVVVWAILVCRRDVSLTHEYLQALVLAVHHRALQLQAVVGEVDQGRRHVDVAPALLLPIETHGASSVEAFESHVVHTCRACRSVPIYQRAQCLEQN